MNHPQLRRPPANCRCCCNISCCCTIAVILSLLCFCCMPLIGHPTVIAATLSASTDTTAATEPSPASPHQAISLAEVEKFVATFNLKQNDKKNKQAKTISRHVDKPYEWLEQSIQHNKWGKRKVQIRSSYSNLEVAEKAIKSALEHNLQKIHTWLNDNNCESISDSASSPTSSSAGTSTDLSSPETAASKEKHHRRRYHSTYNSGYKSCNVLRLKHKFTQEKIGYGVIQSIAETGALPKDGSLTRYESNKLVVILKRNKNNSTHPFFVINSYPTN